MNPQPDPQSPTSGGAKTPNENAQLNTKMNDSQFPQKSDDYAPKHMKPEPRYSVGAVACAIGSLGYPDGPDSSPYAATIRELVDDCEFAEWLKEFITVSSDYESPHYQPDSVQASESAAADAEDEWRATRTLETLTEAQRRSLQEQVNSEFPAAICDEVMQLMPLCGDDDDPDEHANEGEEEPAPAIPATLPYQVTALDNFDFYESSGVATHCRDAAHALSVAKGILERSLAHEHGQAKDPTNAAELFDRWDNFGDYPSISPALDPPFDPSAYASQRAEEICGKVRLQKESSS